MQRLALLPLALSLSLTGCPESKPEATPPPIAPTSPAASITTTPDAGAPVAAGPGVQRMAHCPSAATGARTVVKDATDGVVVTVTGPADQVGDIRARARHVAEVAKLSEPKKIEHTGKGTGGGGLGRCPIVLEGDTTVELKDVEAGVEITVTTKRDVAALRRETRERAASFTSN